MKHVIRWSFILPILGLAYMFWEPMTSSQTLFHPDWAPYFGKGVKPDGFIEFLFATGRACSLSHLLRVSLPWSIYHLYSYWMFVFGTVVCMYLYMRDLALSHWSSLVTGISAGFAGYMLTLVSAGHRTIFEVLFVCAAMLLCLGRAITHGKLIYWLMVGLLTAIGLGTQPDIMVLIIAVVVANYLYTLVKNWRSCRDRDGGRRRVLVGTILAACVFIICSLGTFEHIITRVLPERLAVGASAPVADVGDAPGDSDDRNPEAVWEFCTNWSLPPIDVFEFIAPLVLGSETSSRDKPYWGKVGQSMHWDKTKQGMRNFRQHSLYIGVIQILLALYGTFCVFWKKNVIQKANIKNHAPFWLSVIILALLLSFGRYLPWIYRVFISLPLADTIRCPVKFLHFVNLGVAVLAGYGTEFLMCFIRNNHGNSKPKLGRSEYITLAFVASLAMALFIALVAVKASDQKLFQIWQANGFPQEIHKLMFSGMISAIWHPIVLLSLSAFLIGVVFFLRIGSNLKCGLLGAGLCILIVCDMSSLGRNFVNTIDLSIHRGRNDAIEDAVRGTPWGRIGLLDGLTSRNKHDPIRVNLRNYYGDEIVLLDDKLKKNSLLGAALNSSFSAMVRVMEISGTDYLLCQTKQSLQFLKDSRFSKIGGYGFDGQRIRSSRDANVPISLLKLQTALPRVAFSSKSQVCENEADALKMILSPAHSLADVVVLRPEYGEINEYSSSKTGERLSVTTVRSGICHSIVEVKSEKNGVVILNEPFDARWRVKVNGVSTPTFRANLWGVGAKVLEGDNRVDFIYKASSLRIISTTLILISLAICLIYFVLRTCGIIGKEA